MVWTHLLPRGVGRRGRWWWRKPEAAHVDALAPKTMAGEECGKDSDDISAGDVVVVVA